MASWKARIRYRNSKVRPLVSVCYEIFLWINHFLNKCNKLFQVFFEKKKRSFIPLVFKFNTSQCLSQQFWQCSGSDWGSGCGTDYELKFRVLTQHRWDLFDLFDPVENKRTIKIPEIVSLNQRIWPRVRDLYDGHWASMIEGPRPINALKREFRFQHFSFLKVSTVLNAQSMSRREV